MSSKVARGRRHARQGHSKSATSGKITRRNRREVEDKEVKKNLKRKNASSKKR